MTIASTKLIKINAISISQDNIYIGTASDDCTAKIWDARTGQLLHTFQGYGPVTYINVHLTEKNLAWGYADIATTQSRIQSGISRDGLICFRPCLQKWIIINGRIESIIPYKTNHIFMNQGQHETRGDFCPTNCCNNNTRIIEIINFSADKILLRLVGHTDKVGPMQLGLNDTYLVTGSDDCTAKIWPLSLNLNIPEFQDPNHALFWIKHNLVPLQANLIARAHAATQAEDIFEIDIDTDDAQIWVTFPAHVRQYLCERLNIQLKQQ